MACNASKTPFLRALAARGYSAKAQAQAQPTSKNVEVEGTCLPNKMVIATAENCSPISRVSVVFKAGSRNESYENQGVTHVLRIAAGLGTKGATQFAITRNIQQLGGKLTCTTDRETISYTLECSRDKLGKGLNFLAEVAANQCFQPWDLPALVPRIKYENASRRDEVRVIDLLHKAAFRNGLGNSLYCPKWQIGSLSSETISHYVNCNFKTNRTAVVGLGVSHAEVVAFAQNCLPIESGAGNDCPANYFGGELRKEKSSELTHIALGVAGAGFCNPEEALAFAVLQRALGTGPYVMWGRESGSPLNSGLSGLQEFGATAMNISHSDNGLFGMLLSVPAKDAGKAVETAITVLRSGTVTLEAVDKAKKQLKAAVLMNLESSESYLTDMGNQALLTGKVQSAPVIAAAIDAVTCATVNAVAKRAAAGKLSMSSIGNLSHVPYLDQLK